METTASRLLPHLWKSTLVSGVLALILGVLILVWPGESILAAAVLFGVYLLVTGIAQAIFAFSLPVVSAGGRVLLFLSGTASVILAVLCFRHFHSDEEALAVLLLAIWIAVGFIFRGVATAVAAISDPALPGRGWQIFMGVVSLLAGLVTLASPFASLWILAVVVASWLIVIGVIEIITALKIRSGSRELGAVLSGG
ncbi:HdeD family acid-resistance protein [Mycolicibacter sp. MYC340]|uniref:HdeD family acid-resistance protein n=2 Tax=[Mycobacterium] nativiensis TaxID=2855503 RepID=A0ABU5XS85_9MYCO|nr:HdeD family acid-resistance protein [Mycolicibacter sp. MYC340]MEB3030712.1 HdeD family acid-resistance protein [Mycolicibacter sp. MYC340]